MYIKPNQSNNTEELTLHLPERYLAFLSEDNFPFDKYRLDHKFKLQQLSAHLAVVICTAKLIERATNTVLLSSTSSLDATNPQVYGWVESNATSRLFNRLGIETVIDTQPITGSENNTQSKPTFVDPDSVSPSSSSPQAYDLDLPTDDFEDLVPFDDDVLATEPQNATTNDQPSKAAADSKVDQTPATDEEVIAESDVAPTATDEEAPAESDVAPTATDEEAPAESDVAPTATDEEVLAESDVAPTATDEEASAESDVAPATDEEAPAESEEAPATDEEAPAESEEAPAQDTSDSNIGQTFAEMYANAAATDHEFTPSQDTPELDAPELETDQYDSSLFADSSALFEEATESEQKEFFWPQHVPVSLRGRVQAKLQMLNGCEWEQYLPADMDGIKALLK
jgi:hypothetical protein